MVSVNHTCAKIPFELEHNYVNLLHDMKKIIRVFVKFFILKLGFSLLRRNVSKRICSKCVYYTRNFENQQSCLKTIFITSLVFSWVIRQTSNGFLFPGSAWLAKINMLNWQHTVRLNQAAIRPNKPGLLSEIKAGSFSKRCNVGLADDWMKIVVLVAEQYGYILCCCSFLL